jgi:hypothetical protein
MTYFFMLSRSVVVMIYIYIEISSQIISDNYLANRRLLGKVLLGMELSTLSYHNLII